jgi:hypothetical protein
MAEEGEGVRIVSQLAKAGIELAPRAGHALSAVVGRIGSGRVTLQGVIDTYRNGREFYDQSAGNFIRYDSKTGTTVVTDGRDGPIVTTFQADKPKATWQPVTKTMH